ncbi:MAG: hypothetical protein FWC79_02395 [Oscillospiraceae bacterium]|nr:hypothetical protein [Oscillospiraceae bacterium]
MVFEQVFGNDAVQVLDGAYGSISVEQIRMIISADMDSGIHEFKDGKLKSTEQIKAFRTELLRKTRKFCFSSVS